VTNAKNYPLPGRLGNPDLVIENDPRADRRLVAAMVAGGQGGKAAPSPVDWRSPIEEILQFFKMIDEGAIARVGESVAMLPPITGTTKSIESTRGVDGNIIQLHIHRPKHVSGPLPAVLHLHGGGMVLLDAAGPLYSRWRDELASLNLIAIGVEFRNAAGRLGPYPFPAGLNDCTSALQWVTVLCPYISNAYATKPVELPSLEENDGIFQGCDLVSACAKAYDPSGENATNPLAWPYHASIEDLQGLPPHVISVNELDGFRDEGLAYYRKLQAAGVAALSRTVNGTCHAAENNFFGVIPDIARATLRDIAGFCHSLA
jgi:acetyl esterase